VDNYSIMHYGNLFGQIEYHGKKIRCFVASSISNTGYQRKDPYNYPEDPYSQAIRKSGFDVKTGISYSLGELGSLYADLGYYSREPYFKFVYVNFSNSVARDIRNEKISAAELGYELKQGWLTARLNEYFTLWNDKALLSKENIQLTDSTLTRSLVKGLNALHMGVEFELSALLFKNLSISASSSIANWRWLNDVTASIYNDNHVLVDSTRIYTKELYVGDAPQTQFGASFDYTFLDHFNLVLNWVAYRRLYANFDPSNRTQSTDRQQPFQIPSYHLLDAYLAYDFTILESKASFQISCQNIENKQVITRGDDGADHTLASFSGFWSQGRTFNVSMKLTF
jgi:iron complex outermembrane recepter protein